MARGIWVPYQGVTWKPSIPEGSWGLLRLLLRNQATPLVKKRLFFAYLYIILQLYS